MDEIRNIPVNKIVHQYPGRGLRYAQFFLILCREADLSGAAA